MQRPAGIHHIEMPRPAGDDFDSVHAWERLPYGALVIIIPTFRGFTGSVDNDSSFQVTTSFCFGIVHTNKKSPSSTKLEGLHPVHFTLSGLPSCLCYLAEARQYESRQVF
jgi:hypothetical protein